MTDPKQVTHSLPESGRMVLVLTSSSQQVQPVCFNQSAMTILHMEHPLCRGLKNPPKKKDRSLDIS
jgi:hypothetical protein